MIARFLPRLTTAAAALVVVSIGVFIRFGFEGIPGTQSEPTQASRREEMVKTQLEARGIKEKAVVAAMRKVPRHRFVPALWRGAGVRGRPTADRRGADDFPAIHRGVDDRTD